MARRRKSHGLEGLINCFFEEANPQNDYIDADIIDDKDSEDNPGYIYMRSDCDSKFLWTKDNIRRAYMVYTGNGVLEIHCFTYDGEIESFRITGKDYHIERGLEVDEEDE